MTANSETTLVFHVKSLSLWDSNMARIMSNFMLYILYSKLDIMHVEVWTWRDLVLNWKLVQIHF